MTKLVLEIVGIVAYPVAEGDDSTYAKTLSLVIAWTNCRNIARSLIDELSKRVMA